MEDPRLWWWIQAAAYVAFASFGGLMGHMLRTIESGNKISWARAFIESASAGFVGLLVLLMCQAMSLSAEWTGVIVGMAGWLGANATIRIVETVVRKRLGIDKDNGEV